MCSQCYNTWMGWGIVWEGGSWGGEGRQQNAPAIQHKLGTAELHCQKSVCISININAVWFCHEFLFSTQIHNFSICSGCKQCRAMLAMARPITWLGADGETEPNILSFPTCLSLSKDCFLIQSVFLTGPPPTKKGKTTVAWHKYKEEYRACDFRRHTLPCSKKYIWWQHVQFPYLKGISLLTLFVPQKQGDPWLDVFDEHPYFINRWNEEKWHQTC